MYDERSRCSPRLMDAGHRAGVRRRHRRQRAEPLAVVARRRPTPPRRPSRVRRRGSGRHRARPRSRATSVGEEVDAVGVHIGRTRARRVSALVGRDRAVARGRQDRELLAPLVRRLGEAVQQQHQRRRRSGPSARSRESVARRPPSRVSPSTALLFSASRVARRVQRCRSRSASAQSASSGAGPCHSQSSTAPTSASCAGSRGRGTARRRRVSAASVDASFAVPRTSTSQSAACVGDGLEVPVAGEHRRGRLGAPPGQAGEAVGAVADQREVVGDRLGADAELLAHAGLVEDDVLAPVELHDLRVAARTGRGPCRACRSTTCSTRGSARARPRPPTPARRRPRARPSATR